MTRRTQRFAGSFQQLRLVVDAVGQLGEWREKPSGCLRFKCHGGTILDWRPQTGALVLRGRADAISWLEFELQRAIEMLRAHQCLSAWAD